MTTWKDRQHAAIVRECPKCGSNRGFKGPTYETTVFGGSPGRDLVTREQLVFRCIECQYRRLTPTKDWEPPKVETPIKGFKFRRFIGG